MIAAIVLLAAAYFGYRALELYRANVAPAVAEAAKVLGAVKRWLPSYELTRDPGEIATALESILGIAPPDGYVGALGFTFSALGNSAQIVALLPQGVPPEQVFEGGRGEIRFNAGSHTIFLAARSPADDREKMRDDVAAMVNDSQFEPLRPAMIEAGGRRIAAYTGFAENYGTRNKLVFVFLDDGQLLHAAGPADRFDEAALGRVLAAMVASHPANKLLYEHPHVETTLEARNDPCGIPGLPAEFDVVAISVRRGSTPLDVAIDRSGRDVAREDVAVGITPKPVVLVLMGEDPIVWNVGQAHGATIAGILAVGMHRQVVTGVPRSTRVTTYSTADGPNACPHFRVERANDRAGARRVRELFGRGFTTLLDRKPGPHFVVGEVAGVVTHAPDITLASVALPDHVLPGGRHGIARLVRQQAIRPATEEDVEAWIKGAAQRNGHSAGDVRRQMNWRLDRNSIYVVLKDFDLPDGLAGADSRTFIIPAGASRPGGPQGHCTFLAMDGFQCYGVGCR
jgi:hypothetical protein